MHNAIAGIPVPQHGALHGDSCGGDALTPREACRLTRSSIGAVIRDQMDLLCILWSFGGPLPLNPHSPAEHLLLLLLLLGPPALLLLGPPALQLLGPPALQTPPLTSATLETAFSVEPASCASWFV